MYYYLRRQALALTRAEAGIQRLARHEAFRLTLEAAVRGTALLRKRYRYGQCDEKMDEHFYLSRLKTGRMNASTRGSRYAYEGINIR